MRRLIILVLSAALFTAACSTGDDSANEANPTTEAPTTANSSQLVPIDEPAEDVDASTDRPSVFSTLETSPTEPGPRPLLSWTAIDGAATYDLIVLDASGEPYWAWAGTATSIHLGGMEDPDAVGAWVFEPLTWMVTARDDAGQPLAVSERAMLEP